MNLVVMPDRVALSKVAIGSLAFVALGVAFVALWMSGTAGTLGVVVGVIGLVSISFFGLCGFYAITRLVRPTPALVIDDRGITDNATAVGVGFIAWSDIDDIREYRFLNQAFLGVVPRDLDALVASQPIWKRQIIGLNRLLGTQPVNIPQALLPMPLSDLLRDIRGCRDGHSRA